MGFVSLVGYEICKPKGTFMPSETAMISDSVLDFELSFCTFELDVKLPTPKVTQIPDVDFIFSRLALKV